MGVTTMKTRVLLTGTVLAAAALLATTGCVRVDLPAVEVGSDSDRISLEGASELAAEFEMGAGQLTIGGGADGAMEADYEYTDDRWRPEVSYDVRDGEGRLSVRTPSRPRLSLTGQIRYVWDIALADGIPLDLIVNMGAGESDLDLRTLDVRRLQVNLGAGDSTIELPSDPTDDLTATINVGAGALTLRVPEHVGIRLMGSRDGLGTYQADGFRQDGDALINDAFDDADVRYEVSLRRGVGDVTVETVD